MRDWKEERREWRPFFWLIEGNGNGGIWRGCEKGFGLKGISVIIRFGLKGILVIIEIIGLGFCVSIFIRSFLSDRLQSVL